MANPNPARIPDALWRMWEAAVGFIAGVRLGGILALKSGYHSWVEYNKANHPGNYSIRFALDLLAKAALRAFARAIDLTMSDANMRLYTSRLVAAADRNDPRLFGMREFYGTTDSKKVVGRIRDNDTSSYRGASSDSSHLWHIHISFWAAYCGDWRAVAAVLSVLRGESLSEWEEGDGGVVALPAKGDSGPEVEYIQRLLKEAGHDPGALDGDYGPATEAAVNAFRKAHQLGATTRVTPWTLMALQREALGGERGPVGPRGPAGEDGDDGPPGPPPSQAQISQAVDGWLVQHVEDIRGPAGEPGRTPTKVAISGDVIEVS